MSTKIITTRKIRKAQRDTIPSAEAVPGRLYRYVHCNEPGSLVMALHCPALNETLFLHEEGQILMKPTDRLYPVSGRCVWEIEED